MDEFTIYLLSYAYSKQYDRRVFTDRFPDSMITTALTNPEDNEVDIKERVVTPYVLDYISRILSSGAVPKVPTEDMTQASRYLLIPFLGLVSDPRYVMFRQMYPEYNLFLVVHLDLHYQNILLFALLHQWSALLNYLWERGDVSNDYHLYENMAGLFIAAYMNNVSAVNVLIKHVRDPTGNIDINILRRLLGREGKSNEALWNAITASNLNIVGVSSIGRADDVLALLIANPEFKDNQWTIPLEIAVLNKDIKAIDLLRPFVDPGIRQSIIEDEKFNGNWEVIGHLILDPKVPITPGNVFAYALETDTLWIIPGVMRVLPDTESLQIIRDHSSLSREALQEIIDIKQNDQEFLEQLYDIVLESEDYQGLLEFVDLIGRYQVFKDIIPHIEEDDLKAYLPSLGGYTDQVIDMRAIAEDNDRWDLVDMLDDWLR